jgi:predicted transposase/invertase (TIGR01784 family)
MREISDYNEGVLGIHEAALETGKEEGIQIGMQRMRSEIVLSLKQSGMPIDDIARTVGITSAEVDQLISTSKVHTQVE